MFWPTAIVFLFSPFNQTMIKQVIQFIFNQFHFALRRWFNMMKQESPFLFFLLELLGLFFNTQLQFKVVF